MYDRQYVLYWVGQDYILVTPGNVKQDSMVFVRHILSCKVRSENISKHQ